MAVVCTLLRIKCARLLRAQLHLHWKGNISRFTGCQVLLAYSNPRCIKIKLDFMSVLVQGQVYVSSQLSSTIEICSAEKIVSK